MLIALSDMVPEAVTGVTLGLFGGWARRMMLGLLLPCPPFQSPPTRVQRMRTEWILTMRDQTIS